MDAEIARVLLDCARGSQTGELTFPQVVAQLTEVGVEWYHADYARQEITFYLTDGESLVVPSPHVAHATADEFSAAAVEAAVRQSQRGEHSYEDFVHKTMAVGCVGYFVQITGRQAIYFGRRGECHVERFPTANN